MTSEHAAAVIAAVEAGASIVEAAQSNGIPVSTVRTWLQRGRRDPDGPYGELASRVDAARAARTLPTRQELGDLEEDELRRLVATSARGGNVSAMRFYAERWLSTASDEAPVTEAQKVMDELAERRRLHGRDA